MNVKKLLLACSILLCAVFLLDGQRTFVANAMASSDAATSPRFQATVLSLQPRLDGAKVKIEWVHDDPAITTYQLWSSPAPYFDPEATAGVVRHDFSPGASNSVMTFFEGKPGSGGSRFYEARGMVGSQPRPASAEVGAFSYALTTNAVVAGPGAVDLFASIPQSAIEAAAAQSTLFMHQSTGGYIADQGLGCLAGLHGDPTHFPSECTTYANNRATDGWPWYDNANWDWDLWNPPLADAIAKTDQWVSVVDTRADDYDVLGMKYCYVDGWNQGENVEQNYYIDRMLALEGQYPGKTFIWATSALWGDPGDACNADFNSCQQIAEFNEQVRTYARLHNKPLYDIADIESHEANGQPCTVQDYTGRHWEGLCAGWYSDSAGHPNAAGSLRLAKGFWWVMARIGGWDSAR